jgi:hypothetical protein
MLRRGTALLLVPSWQVSNGPRPWDAVAVTVAEHDRTSSFGGCAAERRRRIATGGAVATAAATTGFLAAGFGWTFILLITVAGAVGTAVVCVLERSRPASWPVARYAALGTTLACASLLWLGWGGQGTGLALALPIAVAVGAAAGALAALAATHLPARHLPWVLGVAVVLVAAAVAGGIARTLPWLPGSYLKVDGPSNWTSAKPLADRLAERLQAQPDPLSNEAWEQVAVETVTPGEEGKVEVGYDRTGSRRTITVWVNGDRACVLVRSSVVVSKAGSCPDS